MVFVPADSIVQRAAWRKMPMTRSHDRIAASWSDDVVGVAAMIALVDPVVITLRRQVQAGV